MIKKFFISALLLLSLSAGAVYAQFADNIKFDGYISDNANILREEAKEKMIYIINVVFCVKTT